MIGNEGRTLTWVGVLLAVMGLVAIVFPFLSSLTIALLFGAALFIAAFAHVAHAFSAPGWAGALGEILLAVVFGIAGFVMLANPILSLTTLTLLLIGYLAAEGLVLLYFAWTLRSEGPWLWSVAAAVITFVLAGMLWVGFPSTAVWALGVLFGVNLVVTGVSMVFVGRGVSSATGTVPPTMTQPGHGA